MVKVVPVCGLDDEDKNRITEFFESRNIAITTTDTIELIEMFNEMIKEAFEAKR